MRNALVRAAGAACLLTSLSTLTTSCSLVGGEGEGDRERDEGGTPTEVVLVTHESFSLPKRLVREFEQDSGFDLVIRAAGDAGTLTNKLVLTADNPSGDVAFGVDNTFAGRALDEGVFAPAEIELPAGAEDYVLPGDDDGALVPIDNGNVCVNVDDAWFADNDLEPPSTLEDLIDPAYEDLLVVPAATTSSPGLAFLLATVARFGEEWPDYWTDLMDNGTRVVAGWSDAYFTDFTGGGGDGDRPIVLSYDSSPAFTVSNGQTTTSALLDGCFQQVEYAGVLAGADNPDGGRELVEFLLGEDVQAALPEAMYVFPVVEGVALPPDWAAYAEQPTDPYTVDPAEIEANRDAWLTQWRDLTSR